MPFEIVRNDITHVRADAIVNTANHRPVIGSGTDAAIHAKAGPALLAARQKIGHIRVGSAAVTPAFGLDAKYVIHTVGPAWRGGLFGEEKLLRRCYETSLQLAVQHGCRSIAFPLISAGNHGLPEEKAMQIAIQAISEFLLEHPLQVYLVVYSKGAFRLSEKLFSSIASYIDDHYVEQKLREAPRERYPRRERNWEDGSVFRETVAESAMPMEPKASSVSAGYSCPMPKMAQSLDELLVQTDAGFTETLLKLIDESGKKDSEVYKKVNISKQHFSKIRKDPNYKPTKPTAVALAIALELDMEQTKDLIGRAGFALTRSSKFDVIIMYFIDHRNYDIHDINAALYEFDQSILGM